MARSLCKLHAQMSSRVTTTTKEQEQEHNRPHQQQQKQARVIKLQAWHVTRDKKG